MLLPAKFTGYCLLKCVEMKVDKIVIQNWLLSVKCVEMKVDKIVIQKLTVNSYPNHRRRVYAIWTMKLISI